MKTDKIELFLTVNQQDCRTHTVLYLGISRAGIKFMARQMHAVIFIRKADLTKIYIKTRWAETYTREDYYWKIT